MKQQLRFFTLALLCAMCSVGWGANYKFAFVSTAIPTGRIPEHLSTDEVPNTFVMPLSGSTADKMPWIFDMKTDATDPIYCAYSAGLQIGLDDKDGVVKHVKQVTFKLPGYFKNVNKIAFAGLKFSNTSGEGTVTLKVGETDCGTHVITGASTQAIAISGSPSGPVEIIIDQPKTTYKLSLSSITITADNYLANCGLSYGENTEYSLDLKETSFTAPRLDYPKDLSESDIYYYSTNPALAAVDKANGKVTLGQANGGSATIYAFFNGNDKYKFGCASYTINMDSKSLWTEDFSSGNLDGYTVNKAAISNTNKAPGKLAPELKILSKGGKFEAVIDLQGLYGDFLLSFMGNASTFDFSTSIGNPGEQSRKVSVVKVPIYDIPEGTKSLTITITTTTKDLYIDDISLTGGTLSKNPVCWMTYCSPSALDFTPVADDFKAFIATSYKSDGSVGLTQINQVPAGMGILIKSSPKLGFLYPFNPSAVATTETIEQGAYTNLLQGVTTDQELATEGTMIFNDEEVPCTNFILAKKDGVVGFYKNKGGTLKANKAYLQLPTDLISGSNSISFYVEDGTTAIQNVSTRPATTDDAWYTLQGVRVAQPTRGLYIHNGKKVVVK